MNQQILQIKVNCEGDDYDIIAAIKEWSNCHEAEVSETGEIWINNPGTGHWLNDDDKAKFVDWCAKQ